MRPHPTLAALTLLLAAVSSPALADPRYAVTDLGSLGPGTESYAYAVNNHGQVVGYSATTTGVNSRHAFLYSDGTMTDLGTLGGQTSSALAINDAGQIVGFSWTANNSAQHAFRIEHDGIMTDLNEYIAPDSGWTLLEARDINDHGQIVGYGVGPAGRYRAFLLTPTPEPSTLTLLTLPATTTALARRRRLPR